jgi:predicted PhzF superfamily epimerase YddE/YHI9
MAQEMNLSETASCSGKSTADLRWFKFAVEVDLRGTPRWRVHVLWEGIPEANAAGPLFHAERALDG